MLSPLKAGLFLWQLRRSRCETDDSIITLVTAKNRNSCLHLAHSIASSSRLVLESHVHGHENPLRHNFSENRHMPEFSQILFTRIMFGGRSFWKSACAVLAWQAIYSFILTVTSTCELWGLFLRAQYAKKIISTACNEWRVGVHCGPASKVSPVWLWGTERVRSVVAALHQRILAAPSAQKAPSNAAPLRNCNECACTWKLQVQWAALLDHLRVRLLDLFCKVSETLPL